MLKSLHCSVPVIGTTQRVSVNHSPYLVIICILPVFSRMVMPSTSSSTFHETESIPFPDVPPEVLEQDDLTHQLLEMQLWFKAWADQDYSVRDYRDYFKAALCYLEGAWVYANAVDLDAFPSEEHFIDAKNWYDLQEQIRYVMNHKHFIVVIVL